MLRRGEPEALLSLYHVHHSALREGRLKCVAKERVCQTLERNLSTVNLLSSHFIILN
jgi:hypothetical protein